MRLKSEKPIIKNKKNRKIILISRFFYFEVEFIY